MFIMWRKKKRHEGNESRQARKIKQTMNMK